MSKPDLTPEEFARIHSELLFIVHPDYRISAESKRTLLGFLPRLLTAYEQAVQEHDRLTAQLVMEQTASNRTIAHLVARRDVLEAELLVWHCDFCGACHPSGEGVIK